MKKVYQYTEILRVWRSLERIQNVLKKIDDKKYEEQKKRIKRIMNSLRDDLDISDLNEVIRELKRKKRNGSLNFVKVHMSDREIYEESRKDHEEKKRMRKFVKELEKKVLESECMNE